LEGFLAVVVSDLSDTLSQIVQECNPVAVIIIIIIIIVIIIIIIIIITIIIIIISILSPCTSKRSSIKHLTQPTGTTNV